MLFIFLFVINGLIIFATIQFNLQLVLMTKKKGHTTWFEVILLLLITVPSVVDGSVIEF